MMAKVCHFIIIALENILDLLYKGLAINNAAIQMHSFARTIVYRAKLDSLLERTGPFCNDRNS